MTDARLDVNGAVGALVRGEVPAIYLLLDRDERVLEANRHTIDLVGEHVVGARFGDLPVTFERGVSPRALVASGPARRDVNFVTFTGLPLTFSCWFVPCGECVVVVGGANPRDQETMRRELVSLTNELAARTRELQKSNLDLTRLGGLKNQFLGMAAHDLRSPLLAVVAGASLLADELDGDLSPAQRETLEELLASADQMHRIIDAFLDVSQIEAGRLALDLTVSDLGTVAEDAARLVRRVQRRDVAVRVLRSEGLPALPIDVAKVRQVVINLLNNAVEHSPAGQDVLVEVTREGDDAVLRVRDRGPGLPPQIQADVFAAFVRDARERTSAGRRIGLGLTIARLIVDAHGGRIGIDSDPGRGATAWVRLPLVRPGGA